MVLIRIRCRQLCNNFGGQSSRSSGDLCATLGRSWQLDGDSIWHAVLSSSPASKPLSPKPLHRPLGSFEFVEPSTEKRRRDRYKTPAVKPRPVPLREVVLWVPRTAQHHPALHRTTPSLRLVALLRPRHQQVPRRGVRRPAHPTSPPGGTRRTMGSRMGGAFQMGVGGPTRAGPEASEGRPDRDLGMCQPNKPRPRPGRF